MIAIRNLKQILEQFPLLQKKIDTALRATVNATATQVRNQAIKSITTETGLAPKKVRDGIEIDRAKTSGTTIEARVIPSVQRITLTHYAPSMTFAGTRGTVRADISVLRGQQVLQNRIFANPKRAKIPFKRKGEKSLPITVPTGPSIAHHLSRIIDILEESARETINETLVKNLYKQLLTQR